MSASLMLYPMVARRGVGGPVIQDDLWGALYGGRYLDVGVEYVGETIPGAVLGAWDAYTELAYEAAAAEQGLAAELDHMGL